MARASKWRDWSKAEFAQAIIDARSTADMEHPAFGFLFRWFQAPIKAAAKKYLPDNYMDDAISDAYLKIIECIKTKIDPREAPQKIDQYLFNAARNSMLDLRRRVMSKAPQVHIDEVKEHLPARIEATEAPQVKPRNEPVEYYIQYLKRWKTLAGALDARARALFKVARKRKANQRGDRARALEFYKQQAQEELRQCTRQFAQN